jgi:hypothetical protein
MACCSCPGIPEEIWLASLRYWENDLESRLEFCAFWFIAEETCELIAGFFWTCWTEMLGIWLPTWPMSDTWLPFE